MKAAQYQNKYISFTALFLSPEGSTPLGHGKFVRTYTDKIIINGIALLQGVHWELIFVMYPLILPSSAKAQAPALMSFSLILSFSQSPTHPPDRESLA